MTYYIVHNTQLVEVEVTERFDRQVHVRAVAGEPFRTCSMLRHHGGQTFNTAHLLYVPAYKLLTGVMLLVVVEVEVERE